jgi:hypothetical protein
MRKTGNSLKKEKLPLYCFLPGWVLFRKKMQFAACFSLSQEMIYCAVVAVLLLIAGAVMIPTPGLYDGARGACVVKINDMKYK